MQWARSMGVSTMANKKTLFVVLVGRAERIEAYLSLFFVDFDIVIAMIACYNKTRNFDIRRFKFLWTTQLITLPLAHACGVIIIGGI